MNSIDFLCKPPNFYIFHRNANKTKFGGVLTLIYGIIMIIIIIYYIFDYKNTYLKDPYSIQSLTELNIKTVKQMNEKNEVHFSQNMNFSLVFRDGETDFIAPDRILIYEKYNENRISNSFTGSTDDHIELLIAYKCDDHLCENYFQGLEVTGTTIFKFSLFYDGFILDHQSLEKPIQKQSSYFMMDYEINLNKMTTIKNYWNQIIYKEKEGYLHKDYVDFGFYMEESKRLEGELMPGSITDKDSNDYLVFCELSIEKKNNNIIEYTRTKKSVLDLLANIFSLFSNIYFLMGIVCEYYSENFNHFKIIEKIISKKIYNIKKKDDKSLVPLNDSENNNKNEKLIDMINDSNENVDKGDIKANILGKTDEEGDEDNESKFKLTKIRFYQFYLNNLYSNYCCETSKSQNIINLCNEIVNKYASIETIIYNQILLEHLFKDYKWNNSELSNVQNNDLIEKLKILESLQS